jgi:hypothetical protein
MQILGPPPKGINEKGVLQLAQKAIGNEIIGSVKVIRMSLNMPNAQKDL